VVKAQDFNASPVKKASVLVKGGLDQGRIPARPSLQGGWEFAVPAGLSSVFVEVSGQDDFGPFSTTVVSLDLSAGGTVQLSRFQVPGTVASLRVPATATPGDRELIVTLGRLSEKYLDGLSGTNSKRIPLLTDPRRVEDTWVLDFTHADLKADCVLFESSLDRPRWFAVGYPSGWSEFNRMVLFFHPEPSQNKDLLKAVNERGYPEGLSTMVRGYLVGNRVNLAYQLARSGRAAMIVMPILYQNGIGVLSDSKTTHALLRELCHRLRRRVRTDHLFPGIDQLAIASFSNGAGYRTKFQETCGWHAPYTELFDFDGADAGFGIGVLRRGVTTHVYDQADFGEKSASWRFPGQHHLPRSRWLRVVPDDDDPHHYILKYMFFHAMIRSQFPLLKP
jgi:hypothetical protein